MIASVFSPAVGPKPALVAEPPTTNKTVSPPAPDTARGSVGEVAAGNIRAETARAVNAPEQTAIPPRFRDRETAEQTNRTTPRNEAPTGPPPSFEESPLERQARVALDPPEPEAEPVGSHTTPELGAATDRDTADPDTVATPARDAPNLPPTPRERAEVSFGETRHLAEAAASHQLDRSA